MQRFENREQMNEYVEKERKRLEERKNKVKEIVSNDNYINWLQEFTIKYPNFRSDTLFDNNKLSLIDKDNINNLKLLFEAIYNYASSNYIYPLNDFDFVEYYRIKYNNISYEIGIITDKGTLFFCERVNNIDDTFIDFNNIILNKKEDSTEFIEKRLTELSNIITYFYEQNIPLNAIKSTINDTLWSIEELDNKNSKKMLKKI